MFDDNMKEAAAIGQTERCRPDYEAQAARLKKRIEADRQCLDGMRAGLENGSVNLNRDQSVLFYGVIGHLYVHIPRAEQEYDKLLALIEEGK